MVATFLVAHGAWSSAWAWKKMRPLMRRRVTSCGRRPTAVSASAPIWRARPSISTHTSPDVLGVGKIEDLADLVLIGHSYGGMVATGVADRARGAHRAADLSRRLRAGERPEPVRSAGLPGRRVRACASGPAPPARVGGCRPIRCRRIRARGAWPGHSHDGLPQPLKAFEQPLRLSGGAAAAAQLHLLQAPGPDDVFRQFGAARATRAGLEILRDGRQPQSAHHRAARG